MSKIGRSPILLDGVEVSVSGSTVSIKGENAQFSHDVPSGINVALDGNSMRLTVDQDNRFTRQQWGLHRALLANKVSGARKNFEKKITIIGLGYKAVISGDVITFSLGYTHPIKYDIPKGVSIVVDKSGQKLVASSADKFLLGNACDKIRMMRKPEPYKGTGIFREGDTVVRKEGKTKSS